MPGKATNTVYLSHDDCHSDRSEATVLISAGDRQRHQRPRIPCRGARPCAPTGTCFSVKSLPGTGGCETRSDNLIDVIGRNYYGR